MMRKMVPPAKLARLSSLATRGLASQPKIVWTYTDEAPALATFALLPVVKRFTNPAGLDVALSDISVAGRIISKFPERLKPEQRQRDEGMLWPRSVASSEQDYHRILKLLEGCDILHHCSDDEYLAPALLADTQLNKLDARAFSTPDGCCAMRLGMSHLPDGFFARLLVRLARNYSHLDFSRNAAALYGRALKLQIFVTNDGVRQGEHVTDRAATIVHIFASTRQQVKQVEEHIRELHLFFNGMVFIEKDGRPSRGLKFLQGTNEKVHEPIQVQFLRAEAGKVQKGRESISEKIANFGAKELCSF